MPIPNADLEKNPHTTFTPLRMTSPNNTEASPQPQTCEQCSAPIPHRTGTLALCDDCYIASTDTCCSDA